MNLKSEKRKIAVLGAGIMGSCLSLELSQRGYEVVLFDSSPSPMSGASLHNEGKLHLGFVYAKDPVKETYRTMIRGSLSFIPILQRLTGVNIQTLKSSNPFYYFVPNSSQLNLEQVEEHFDLVEKEIRQLIDLPSSYYFDRKISDRWWISNAPESHRKMFSPELSLGSFQTEERAVSTVDIAEILCRAIDHDPNITFIPNTRVMAAEILDSGDVAVEVTRDGQTSRHVFPFAVNCLWNDKVRLDRTAGIVDDADWYLRYKATVTLYAKDKMDTFIPSATGILGPYGDIANHGDNYFYISWYPETKLAETTDIMEGYDLEGTVHGPIARWIKKQIRHSPGMRRLISSIFHRGYIKKNIRGIAEYLPAAKALLSNTHRWRVGGGVVLARGTTDIDDPESHLHQRSAVGPVAHGPYISVYTGKFCTAPHFAVEAAELISKMN